MPEKLLTVTQVAKRLGLHENTIRKYADTGVIKVIKLPSGYRRFTEDEVVRVEREMGLRESDGRAEA